MSRLVRKARTLESQYVKRLYRYSQSNFVYGNYTGLEDFQSPHPANGKDLTSWSGSWDALQETWSQGNPWPELRDSGMDVGGPFRTRKHYFAKRLGGPSVPLNSFTRHTFFKARPGIQGFCYSPLFVTSPEIWGNDSAWNDNHWFNRDAFLNAWGSQAIERVKPTRTANSLYVSLKEIKSDGLPKMFGLSAWKEKTRALRGAGSEYLNYQFGWLPLINDIQKFANSVNRFEQIWSQYERDAGRLVRRSYRPDPETTTTVTISGPPVRVWPGDMEFSSSTSGMVVTTTTTVETRRWFSGAFTYYLPDRGSRDALSAFRRDAQKLNHLLGLLPTPDMIWSATPWTWALDWFTNVGSVISNLSDKLTDSLVLPYGYVCEHITKSVETSSTGGTLRRSNSTSSEMPRLYLCSVRETKQRIQSTPYGFGLTWEGFSPSQMAILAALGITRGR